MLRGGLRRSEGGLGIRRARWCRSCPARGQPLFALGNSIAVQWRTLSSFINLFLSLSTSSRSTALCQHLLFSPAAMHTSSGACSPWTYNSSRRRCCRGSQTVGYPFWRVYKGKNSGGGGWKEHGVVVSFRGVHREIEGLAAAARERKRQGLSTSRRQASRGAAPRHRDNGPLANSSTGNPALHNTA